MPTSFSVCQRKARYKEEDQALAVAAKAPFPLRPYRCDLCRQFHLTGRTKRMRLPKFEQARRKADAIPS